MRHSQIITGYRLSQSEAFSLVKCIQLYVRGVGKVSKRDISPSKIATLKIFSLNCMEFLTFNQNFGIIFRLLGALSRPHPGLCTPLVTEPTFLSPPKQIPGYAPAICVLFLVWKIDPRLMKIWAKNEFCILVLMQWPWPLTFGTQTCSLVTLIQRCVSTKLEDSTAFLLRENRRHGTDERTDRRTECNF